MLSNGQRIEEPLQPTGIKVGEFETDPGVGRSGDPLDVTPAPAPRPGCAGRIRSTAPVSPGASACCSREPTALLALRCRASTRVGRSGNLVFALFAFILYFNLLNLGQSWVGSGRFGVGGFLLAARRRPGAGPGLLAKRHFNWGFPTRRVPAQPATTSNAKPSAA
jgi:lipopolysaccharide export system permease protein